MAEQVVKKPQEILEEVISEETDTKIETKSAIWNQRINLELTRRTMQKTEKKISENGKEQRKIEFDEDTDRSIVYYPSPEKIYSEEADRVTAEIQAEEPVEEKVSRQKPQLVLVKLEVPQREPREKQVVEVSTPEEELKPTTEAFETEDTVPESFEVGEVESFSFKVEREVSQEIETGTEDRVYRQENSGYQEPETENFSPPKSPVENPFRPDLDVEKEYSSGGILETETEGEEDYDRFSPLLEDFEDLEQSEKSGDAVFTAEYGEDSEVSERLVMDLESMFPYRDSVSGSEAVEALESYGVGATVAEVPYFSENSGGSWEEGWNSFDMVLQMNGMSMLDTEYLSGDLYELGEMEQPAQRSIGAEFSTDQAIEFRESEEFSSHTGGYEGSERTREAWAERYGEEILELDGIERGVYAAFEEDRNLRGAEMSPGET